jgi:peroxiredoxin
MLEKGQIAPNFIIKDIHGIEVSLTESKYSFVSFHRFAACPFCVLRTRELIKSYPLFEQSNIEIISIWPSSRNKMLEYVGTENAPFPLISDDKKELFKKYDVVKSSALSVLKLMLHPAQVYRAIKGKYKNIEVDADPNLLPAEFLVSPNGKILFTHYGKHFNDHVDIQQIFSVASKSN